MKQNSSTSETKNTSNDARVWLYVAISSLLAVVVVAMLSGLLGYGVLLLSPIATIIFGVSIAVYLVSLFRNQPPLGIKIILWVVFANIGWLVANGIHNFISAQV